MHLTQTESTPVLTRCLHALTHDADSKGCCLQPPPPPPPQSQSYSGSKTVSAAPLDSVQAAAAPSAVSEGAAAPVPDDSREPSPPICCCKPWEVLVPRAASASSCTQNAEAQLILCMSLDGQHASDQIRSDQKLGQLLVRCKLAEMQTSWLSHLDEVGWWRRLSVVLRPDSYGFGVMQRGGRRAQGYRARRRSTWRRALRR